MASLNNATVAKSSVEVDLVAPLTNPAQRVGGREGAGAATEVKGCRESQAAHAGTRSGTEGNISTNSRGTGGGDGSRRSSSVGLDNPAIERKLGTCGSQSGVIANLDCARGQRGCARHRVRATKNQRPRGVVHRDTTSRPTISARDVDSAGTINRQKKSRSCYRRTDRERLATGHSPGLRGSKGDPARATDSSRVVGRDSGRA